MNKIHPLFYQVMQWTLTTPGGSDKGIKAWREWEAAGKPVVAEEPRDTMSAATVAGALGLSKEEVARILDAEKSHKVMGHPDKPIPIEFGHHTKTTFFGEGGGVRYACEECRKQDAEIKRLEGVVEGYAAILRENREEMDRLRHGNEELREICRSWQKSATENDEKKDAEIERLKKELAEANSFRHHHALPWIPGGPILPCPSCRNAALEEAAKEAERCEWGINVGNPDYVARRTASPEIAARIRAKKKP